MKTKRTVTDRVLAANQANGQKNRRGPRNPQNTRYNAITHALLSSKLVFRGEDEKRTFETLVAELTRHHAPFGPTEQALVSEMAICLWRLRDLYGWESIEIRNHTNAAAAIVEGLRENGEAQELPLFAATQQGWSIQELVVRSGSRSSADEETLLDDARAKTGHLILETKSVSALETILRYGAAIRRDFYRALTALRELQQERLELEVLQPVSREDADDQ
jgi:hypothetical protein